MKRTTRIGSELSTRSPRRGRDARRHKLPICPATQLARYRDRHQARQGAEAKLASSQSVRVSPFACPSCLGFHLDQSAAWEPINLGGTAEPTERFLATLSSRKRRYMLVDIENPTRGAKASRDEVFVLWSILKQQAPGIAAHDHVVVGASRSVARKYRPVIHGANVRWVVGADAQDGADRALLAAIDLHRVAARYDELVIVSGDHVFADLARCAKKAGLSVQVVTAEHPEQRSMLARELAAAADTHTRIRLQPRTRPVHLHSIPAQAA